MHLLMELLNVSGCDVIEDGIPGTWYDNGM